MVQRRPASPTAKRRSRFLFIAVLFSVVFHLMAALMVVSLAHILPEQPQPREQGTVELLMVEQKGSQSGSPVQPQEATPAPKPQQNIDLPKVEHLNAKAVTPPPKGVPIPPAPEPTSELAPVRAEPAEKAAEAERRQPEKAEPQPVEKAAEAEPQPAEKEVAAQPAPPSQQKAPVFNLEGTDSESNAIVLGGRVLPAMKDDRYRNRPPIYPVEAEERGEHGAVVVMIHVAENGLASDADVVESSGSSALDHAALTAVRKWHFHPAMKEGRSVPFDMPFRFIFEPY